MCGTKCFDVKLTEMADVGRVRKYIQLAMGLWEGFEMW